jgi:hypothetical protein
VCRWQLACQHGGGRDPQQAAAQLPTKLPLCVLFLLSRLLWSQTSASHAAAPARHQPPRVPFVQLCCCSTFFRIWAFLILEFHFMAVMLWGWGSIKRGSYYSLCSVALNHAFLSLLEQLAGAWTQRATGVCVCAPSVAMSPCTRMSVRVCAWRPGERCACLLWALHRQSAAPVVGGVADTLRPRGGGA